METCFNYCHPEKAFFSSDERRWIKKIKKLIEQYPDEIRVIALPETNDGCIYVELPSSWLKVSPPRKLNLSDERREELRKQMSSKTRSDSTK